MTDERVAGDPGGYICWFEDCGGASVATVGGKCASLGELLRAGVDVPPGFALTTAAHRDFLAVTGVNHEAAHLAATADLHDRDSVAAVTAQIRSLFEQCDIPSAIDDAISASYSRLGERAGRVDPPVAVRSSATAEDHHAASFAGQLETYLWVEGIEAVHRYVRRCWSALFEPHTVTYCQQVGVAYEDMVMSLGIQQMVNAKCAGVLFTLNPINGDRSKVLVESCWGLGEGVVTGEVDADRFMLDKVTFDILDRHHGAKSHAFRHVGGDPLVELVPVEANLASAPSLSDDELVALAKVGKQIERHYGIPMDVEWAIGSKANPDDLDHLFILQARPETVASRSDRSTVERSSGSALDVLIQGMVARGGRGDPAR